MKSEPFSFLQQIVLQVKIPSFKYLLVDKAANHATSSLFFFVILYKIPN